MFPIPSPSLLGESFLCFHCNSYQMMTVPNSWLESFAIKRWKNLQIYVIWCIRLGPMSVCTRERSHPHCSTVINRWLLGYYILAYQAPCHCSAAEHGCRFNFTMYIIRVFSRINPVLVTEFVFSAFLCWDLNLFDYSNSLPKYCPWRFGQWKQEHVPIAFIQDILLMGMTVFNSVKSLL